MVKDKATNAKQAGIENKQHSMQAGNKAELSKKAESESVEDLFRSVYGHELGGQGRVAEVVVAKTAEVQGVNTQDAIDKIEKIVDRIQVLAAGDVKTVNIKLNNSILADTEIRFHRESGVIKIEFMTSSADSFNFLSKGEQALMASMNKKFDDNVSVSIQLQQSDNSDQSGDGRSRNQYTGEEPSEDDANE